LAWTVADHAGRDKLGRDELAIVLTMRWGEGPGIARHPRRRRQPTELPPDTETRLLSQFSGHPSRCVATTVNVAAGNFFSHQRPGPDQPLRQPDKVRQAGVFIGNFDSCTNTLLLSANGSHAVDKNSFQGSSQLTSAELTTSFNAHDLYLPQFLMSAWT
jgi:hypothetical protein